MTPTRMTVRADDDLLALAPVLLGFWPDQDIVMLTFGAPRPFHARMDLPRRAEQTPACLEAVVRSLLGPAMRHQVPAVAVLLVGHETDDARGVWPRLERAFADAGIAVVRALAADGRHLRSLAVTADGDVVTGRPVAYDVATHPFVLEAVVDGRLGFDDRASMVASLADDPSASEGVAEALACLAPVAASTPAAVRAELSRQAAAGPPSALDLARLLGLLDMAEAWASLAEEGGGHDREGAERERWFWARVLPRTPGSHVAKVAEALGYAAWRVGDGAMAWAAVDRARAAPIGDGERAGLVRLVRLLAEAVPPTAC